MTWQKERADGSTRNFNFFAPDGVESQEVLFPSAVLLTPDVVEGESPAPDTVTVAVNQMVTFAQPAELEGAVTLNLAIAAQVTKGAFLHLKLVSDEEAGNKTVTLGTGFSDDVATVTVVSAKTACVSFVFDGTEFVPLWFIQS
jgi:hypothetical protein